MEVTEAILWDLKDSVIAVIIVGWRDREGGEEGKGKGGEKGSLLLFLVVVVVVVVCRMLLLIPFENEQCR